VSSGGWDELKKPMYGELRMASRLMQSVGNKVGWQGLEDEAKYNQKNPGHAATKITEYALPVLLGAYFGGGAAGAGAAGEAGAGAAGGEAADLAAQQAALQAAQGGGMAATDESAGLLGANYAAPVSDLSINTVPVKEASTQAGLLDKARLGFTGGNSSTTGKGGLLAQQMGLKMMMPQQQPQRAPMGRPAPQASNEQLHYAYGTPQGNSLGSPLTEEQKRKLRAQGYQIP
jgi:hypothetical protein